jgi:hypothetical protein
MENVNNLTRSGGNEFSYKVGSNWIRMGFITRNTPAYKTGKYLTFWVSTFLF